MDLTRRLVRDVEGFLLYEETRRELGIRDEAKRGNEYRVWCKSASVGKCGGAPRDAETVVRPNITNQRLTRTCELVCAWTATLLVNVPVEFS